MPIYEYVCQSCNAKFEQLVRSMSGAAAADATKPKCPTCGSSQTSRSLSVFAVGAETSGGGGKTKGNSAPPGMCGRCGGPGPCPSGY